MPDNGNTFARLAHVAMRGENIPASEGGLPDITGGNLAVNARLLWQAVRHHADMTRQTGDTPATYLSHGDRPGLRLKVNVSAIAEQQWPRYRAQEHDAEAVRRAIQGYLRDGGNMACIEHGTNTRPSTWWVSETFAEGIRELPHARTTRGKPGATKVTREELGLDRAPAPVQVSYACTWPGCNAPAFRSARERTHHGLKEHRTAAGWIRWALETSGEPARMIHISDAAAAAGFTGSVEILRRAAFDMVEAGDLSVAYPTSPETPVFRLPGMPEGSAKAIVEPGVPLQAAVPVAEPVVPVFRDGGEPPAEAGFSDAAGMFMQGLRALITQEVRAEIERADIDSDVVIERLQAENRMLRRRLARRGDVAEG